MTGVSSAAGSLSSAGSSLMAGEFGTAASTIGNSWGAAASAGAAEAAAQTAITAGLNSGVANAGLNAQGNLVAGSANTTNAITMNGVTPTANMGVSGSQAVGGAESLGSGLMGSGGGWTADPSLMTATQTGGSSAVSGASNAIWQADPTMMNAANGGTGIGAGAADTAAGMSAGEGLMWSAGINAGTQAAGGYFNAKSQEKAEQEERERRERNMLGKQYGSGFQYDIKSAFTPKTLDELRGA